MSCEYRLDDKILCGREPDDAVHFPCGACRGDDSIVPECHAELAIGIKCHLFVDETNRHMFPAYASAGTKAMDGIKDSLFGWPLPAAPITDADIQNAEALQDEMKYVEISDVLNDASVGPWSDWDILRAAAHVLRMAKETGPTKMTTVLYLDQYAEEAEKAEEEA